MNPETKVNKAEQLIHTPIKWSVAAIAIALMFSLALNATVRGVATTIAQYEAALIENEAQLASLMAPAKRNTTPVVEEPLTGTPQETDRIIVKYKDDAKLPPGLSVAAERANLEKAQGLVKVLTINGINADVYQVGEDDTAQEVVDRLLAQDAGKGLIEYAEVDMLVPPALVPNDPLFASQWHHPVVQTPVAWDTALGEGVIFTVLDTGVNQVADLAWSSVPARNFYDGTTNVADVYGHGTKVAGTAAAIGNNALGVSGISPNTKVLPIRISGDDGYGSISAAAQGITYAADNGSRVANASYSFCGYATIQNAASYMRSKGGVVTISAGNSGADSGFAQNSNLTCVSATASNDLRTSWSSFGQYVDVAAPGAGIYTTTQTGGYGGVSGTSFSAPLTAGIYALMFSVNPSLTPNQADNILFTTADDLGAPGWDMYYGHGRVNAAKAVAAAQATIGTRDTVAPSVPQNLRTTNVAYNSVALAWNASTDDNTGVAQYDIYENTTKIASISGTTYTHTGRAPLTSYTYTVRAVDGAGNISQPSTPLQVTTPDVAFAISSYSVPQKTTNGATVAVTLTKPGTVTVKYGTSATNLNQTVQSNTTSTSHNLSITGLSAKTTYYYQVVAQDGTTTITGAVSNFKTAAGGTSGTGGGKKR